MSNEQKTTLGAIDILAGQIARSISNGPFSFKPNEADNIKLLLTDFAAEILRLAAIEAKDGLKPTQ